MPLTRTLCQATELGLVICLIGVMAVAGCGSGVLTGNNTLFQMGGARQGVALNLTTAVTTLAGSGAPGAADNTTGTLATFRMPDGITTDGWNLYVADVNNHDIRKIVIASGEVSTLAGTGAASAVDNTGTLASFNLPHGITTDGRNLYVADTGNNKIRQIVIATREVTTLAGTGTPGAVDFNTGTLATFNAPCGITTDGANLYVADTGNNKIRQIVIASGAVTTLAGTGASGANDTAPGVSATFNGPKGITTDGTNLYVADTGNNKIRKIVIISKEVTTLAGTGSVGADDSAPSIPATFSGPVGITTDGTSLYVADTGNNTIRKIVINSGVVTTLAGSALAVPGAVDNATGILATFNGPGGVTTDGIGVFVSDLNNNKVRKIQ